MFRRSIRYRLTVIICILMVTSVLVSSLVGYFTAEQVLRHTILTKQSEYVQSLQMAFTKMIDREEAVIRGTFDSFWVRQAVRTANQRYQDLNQQQRQQYFAQQDQQWQQAGQKWQQYPEINWPACQQLKKLIGDESVYAQIFFTDKYGGLIAASEKTTDFYQADKPWWQQAAAFRGINPFVEDISFDKVSNTFVFTIAKAIVDADGTVIGVGCVRINFEKFVADIERLVLLSDKHMGIVNQQNRIILYKNIVPLSDEYAVFDSSGQRVYVPEHEKGVLENARVKNRSLFVVWSKINHALLQQNGINWFIFIEQPVEHVYDMLGSYRWRIIGVILLLLLVLVPIGLLVGGMFVRPIGRLRQGAEKISSGDLNYKIDVRTADEIGEVAAVFNEMVDNLKKMMLSDKALGQEIIEHEQYERQMQQQAKQLEGRLKKEARDRQIMLSMLEDHNLMRQQLENKIYELKRTQRMLVQSEKLVSLGRMVSEMAHEVNNPLMIISGRAQLSLMTHSQGQQLIDNLKVICEQSIRAGEIIRRLLAFSRPSKGETKRISLNTIVDDSIKLVEHQYSLKNIVIKRQFDIKPAVVTVDVNQVEEVFINVFNNSAAAMPNGGVITVATIVKEKHVQILISDTGCGMTDDVLDKVFDPFFTTHEHSSGLGLSVCHGIVNGHGGQIVITSRVNEGTTVSITLPCA